MAKFHNTDFEAMYAGFRFAMGECERVTGRTFRVQRDAAIWVDRAGYSWVNQFGEVRREKAVQWKVPAVRFWPGGQLPAMLAEIDTSAKPAYAATYEGFLADTRAFSAKIAALMALDCARDPAKRAKRDRAVAYVRARRYAALAAQPVPQPPVAAQVAQVPIKAARPLTKAAKVAIEQTPEFRAALDRAIAEKIAELAAAQPESQMIEREKTMQEFRQYAEAPGRVIPDGATVITGPGGAVYLYEKRGVTGKGKPYVQHYAKAFRPGARKPDWHHVFNSEAERAARAEAFLALVWDRTAVPA